MSKNVITIRTYPGGLPASGITYFVKRHSDDVTLQTGPTDANGQFTYAPNLAPGPFYWQATDAGPEPDVTRKGSTKSCDSGGGFSLAEVPIALRGMGQAGVVRNYYNDLLVTLGAGINFNVLTGAAVILGLPAVIATAISNQAVSNTRDATNPRACYVILQAKGPGQSDEGLIIITDKCGAAAASPSLPALTQGEAVWEEPIASFRLPPTGGGSVLTNLDTTVRRFLLTKNPQVAVAARRVSQTAVNVTSTTGADVAFDDGTTSPTLVNGVTYDVVTTVTLAMKAAAGQSIGLAPYINGTANAAIYLSTTTSGDFITVTNTHTLTVVGTGAPLVCGALVKVSGGTGSHLTGSQLVTATPRR